jgi:diacylglycerol kinase family enzyme
MFVLVICPLAAIFPAFLSFIPSGSGNAFSTRIQIKEAIKSGSETLGSNLFGTQDSNINIYH